MVIQMEHIYIIEAIIAIVIFMITFFILLAKKKKIISYIKVFSIMLLVTVIAMGTQYLLEKPHLRNKEPIKIEVNQKDKLLKPEMIYHGKEMSEQVEIIGEVDYHKVGEYEVQLKIPYLNGYTYEKQVVKVIDEEPPVITLTGGEEITQSYQAKEYVEPGFTVSDNYDEDLTQKVTCQREEMNDKQFKIHYTVTDSSGNTATAVRTVTIVDDISPVITLKQASEIITIYVGDTYTEKGATAIDEMDGDVSEKIQISGSVDISKVGTYQVHYRVSDMAGNMAEKVLTVQVIEKQDTGGIAKPGTIYLTFDDGPSSSITPKILDILKEKNVKATFFILNYGSSTEELVKREAREGHSIGIHGYSHDYHQVYQSEKAYMENLSKLREKIKASTGVDTVITRFPGGSSNTVSKFNPGIMTRLTKLVVDKGYRYFDWNVSSGDAGDVKTKEAVYQNVTKGLSKNRANVVLMHDFSGNTKTLNALADIIDYGKANGYTFDRITPATAMVTHRVNN